MDWLLSPIEQIARRGICRLTRRKDFGRWQRLRNVEDPNSYSLLPLIRRRCIFVHVPKCAGTSLCRQLFGSQGPGHIRIKDYQVALSVREFSHFFKFTIVRNPWDRLVSAFHYLKAGGMNRMDREWALSNISRFQDFDEFVREWVNSDNVNDGSYFHFRPQVSFVRLTSGVIPLDFIGRTESLDDDLAEICSHLHMPQVKLRKHNASQHEPYQKLYVQDTRAIVERVYAEDIKTFDYKFD